MAAAEFDGIIIGAGPNGLTLAAYLAKAGLKILLIEKRYEIGGGLATEQVTLPGFLNNTHAIYMPMADYAPAFKDLELETEYDLQFIYPDLVMAMPFPDGRMLGVYKDPEKTAKTIEEFSKTDAKNYRELWKTWKWMMDDYLGPATYELAKPTFESVVKMEMSEVGRAIAEVRLKTPKQAIDDWFENDQVRAFFLYGACMWGLDYDLDGISFMVPLLLDRMMNYRMVRGGSHHLAHVLYKAVTERGGKCYTSHIITRIVVEDGVAKGVELDDGRIIRAKFVASTIDPHQTFLKLMNPDTLDPALVQRVRDWQWEEISLFDVHMALTEAPKFKAAEKHPELNEAFIYVLGYEGEQDLIDHWEAIKKGELVTGGFNACFPSVHDPLQAPKGRHTGLLSSHAPYELKDGGADKWYSPDLRHGHEAKMLEVLKKYAPNINEDTILWSHCSSPKDIENKFADMVKGSFKQGKYTPLQMGFMRPNEYCSNHRTPVKNLYVCGASTFPGGLILLGGGYNCAAVVCEDLGVEKWWPECESLVRCRELGTL